MTSCGRGHGGREYLAVEQRQRLHAGRGGGGRGGRGSLCSLGRSAAFCYDVVDRRRVGKARVGVFKM